MRLIEYRWAPKCFFLTFVPYDPNEKSTNPSLWSFSEKSFLDWTLKDGYYDR